MYLLSQTLINLDNNIMYFGALFHFYMYNQNHRGRFYVQTLRGGCVTLFNRIIFMQTESRLLYLFCDWGLEFQYICISWDIWGWNDILCKKWIVISSRYPRKFRKVQKILIDKGPIQFHTYKFFYNLGI